MAKYIKLFNNHNEYTAFTQTEEFVKPNVSYCISENEVHYNSLPKTNGHAYVDLGLPSGTLWATMNVGANSETDKGLYFQWGDVQGYSQEQVGTDKTFDWTTYKYCNGAVNKQTKYCNKSSYGDGGYTDELTELELSDDAAHVIWGGDWHMPTKQQVEELITNTTVIENENGYTLTAQNGNSLYFPKNGYYTNTTLNTSANVFVWTNALANGFPPQATYFESFGSNFRAKDFMRNCGLIVRGVI